MSVFEYLQSCTIEEFAEWLVAFQSQCEDNVVEQFENAGVGVSKINFVPALLELRMVQYLQEEIVEEDNDDFE